MLEVLRRHEQFRKLWLSQVVSETGDWLNRVAILTIIGRLSEGKQAALLGIGLLYAVELATRLLPTALMGPLAGPVADLLPRRALMVAADLARAAVVLCMLFVREAEDLPLLYGLLVVQMSLGIFFHSARSASLPNTVPREQLHEAYALSALTWSAMLSFGALLGGLLVGWIGARGVFVVDAATYVASAVLLYGLRLPPLARRARAFRATDVLLFTDLRHALRHVRELRLLPAILAKSFWGGCGGFLVILSLTAVERFGTAAGTTRDAAEGAATAVGLLFFARGLGTGIGPLFARRIFGEDEAALRRQVSVGYGVGALGYAFLAFSMRIELAIACVAFAHMGGSTMWVASTVLWQRRVEDAFRGRVFALEFLGMTVSFSLGGLVAGALYDGTGSLPVTIWTTAALVLVMGALWTHWSRGTPTGNHPREDPAVSPASEEALAQLESDASGL